MLEKIINKLFPPQESLKNKKEYEIPYSKNFRGFKRFHVVVHGYEESEKNNEKLYNQDLSSMTIKFICFNGQQGRMAFLYADNYKLGAVFDDDQLYAIEHKKIEKIHFEPKEEVVIEKRTTKTRHRISVLVKYKE